MPSANGLALIAESFLSSDYCVMSNADASRFPSFLSFSFITSSITESAFCVRLVEIAV